MSAEDEQENETPGESPSEPTAKKPAAKKPAAEKPAADEPVAKTESPAEVGEAAEAEKAEKPAEAEKPAKAVKAAKTEKAEKPAEAEKTAKAKKAEKPAEVEKIAKAEKAEKPAAKKPAKATKGAAEDDSPAEELATEQAEAPEPKPARAKAISERRPVVRARARYVRTSARKARMVCGHIRGKSVQEARAILAFTPRDVARDWSKLLESAVANAENNHELLEDDLIVREVYADEGPTIKRFRPRAMGRATPIRKRTSHLTITLTPRS
jgi:ribosomal protein L22